jgi:AcrR family transcriptional regulator
MTRIANPRTRSYQSQLRAEQAADTRSRILEAALRAMADGVTSLSVPAVAREAGVSVPTVYRHFGTKRALVNAIYPHLAARAGIGPLVAPESVAAYKEMVRSIFSRLETLGEVARLAMSSPAAEEARREQMPARSALSRRFAATVMRGASPEHQQRLARVLIVLASSSSMRMWRDHLGSSVDEAADDIEFVLRSVIATAEGTQP